MGPLVECSDCKHKVSSRASMCPACGAPLEAAARVHCHCSRLTHFGAVLLEIFGGALGLVGIILVGDSILESLAARVTASAGAIGFNLLLGRLCSGLFMLACGITMWFFAAGFRFMDARDHEGVRIH